MIKIGYHGTNQEIEVFDLNHLGSNQGQTVFPGIYFADNYQDALQFANLAVEKSGGSPIVYIAECQLDKPLRQKDLGTIFNSLGEMIRFCKEYFPSWFDESGEILFHKLSYVEEKFETYYGQYNFIRYAAQENGISTIEIFSKLGFDSLIGHNEFVITSPQQILSFEEADHQYTRGELEFDGLSATEGLSAYETKSNDYIRAAKAGKPYKTKPGNRFTRRVRIKLNGGNNIWFDLDMNRLFKKGSFCIKIPVIGETDSYVCSISFDEWLPKLKADIAKTGFNQLTIKRSLMEMLRFKDLKVRCTCPDFKYRHSYWLTIQNEIEGEPEIRPSDETNPKNDLGKICKHLSFCFTGDTLIKTLDGRTWKFEELVKEFRVNKNLWVYSTNEKGDFRPGKIVDAFKSGEVTKLVEVELDNGEKIKCTPDHPFMLRDGTYLEAGKLQPGQSLMPLYFGTNKKGYELVKLNSSGKYSPVYFRVANYCKSVEVIAKRQEAELEEGPGRRGVAIHHKDFNKNNNSPDNLIPMTIMEHIKYHSENGSFKRLWEDPEFRKKYSKVSSEFMTNLQANPTPALIRSRENSPLKGRPLSEEIKAKISQGNIGKVRSDETRRKISQSKLGTELSLETRKKLSKAKLGKTWSPKMRETADTEEFKAKKSEATKNFWNSLSPDELRLIEIKRLEKRESNRKAGLHKSREQMVYSKDNSNYLELKPRTQRRLKQKIGRIMRELAYSGLPITSENYNLVRASSKQGNRTRWQLAFSTFEEAKTYYQVNHQVVSVKELEVPPTSVYDITVEGFHNFLVANSVVVHNCLNNKVYGDKVSRIIYNYLINLKRTMRPLFEKTVAPQLGLDQLEESKGGLKKLEPVPEETEELVKEVEPGEESDKEESEDNFDLEERL